ncbi:hypothetical protein VW23_010015 [Devosia insulae DS-56]|uniref:Uncharacterized protein n=1 Tax=Devosia insulae DS-56 TaxID=1116389 RepID=A0A1E5XVZ5_9HYPH|nr:hypothetical protein [Devosia insulae]OEO32773.1 hypothetical protein VW23_010015 [Devosia insulae DS-56]
MGWQDAPFASPGTQRWQNAPLLRDVPLYGLSRAKAFGTSRPFTPVPDYSEQGVRAMRSRLRDLGDIPYQHLTDEQHAESQRLSDALDEVDGMRFNLYGTSDEQRENRRLSVAPNEVDMRLPSETTLRPVSADSMYQPGLEPLDQAHAALTSTINSIPVAGVPIEKQLAQWQADLHNFLKPDDIPITQSDVLNTNVQRELQNKKGALAGKVIGNMGPYLAASRVATLAKLLGFEGKLAERLGYGTLSQYLINTSDAITREGKDPVKAAREAIVPTLLTAPLALIGDPPPPGRAITAELTRAGIGVDDAEAALNAVGPDAVLGDLSPRLQTTLGTIPSKPGPAQDLVINAMRLRAAGTGDRIKAGLEEIFGPAPIPSREAAAITARQDALLLDETLGHVPGTRALDDQFDELTRQHEGLDLGALALRNGDRDAVIHPADFGDAFAAGALPRGEFIGPSGVPVRIQQGMIADIARIIGTRPSNPAAMHEILSAQGTWNREKLVTAFGQETADRLTRLFDGEAQMAATKASAEKGLATEMQKSADASLDPSTRESTLWSLMKGNYGDAALQAFNRLTGGLAVAEQRMANERMALALLGRVVPAANSVPPPLLLSALARGLWGAGQQPSGGRAPAAEKAVVPAYRSWDRQTP